MSIQSGNLEEFLTVAEVADMLKLNQQTVRNWIDQGSLPAHRVGRRVRIRRSDLDRMLDEGYTARGVADSGLEGAGGADDSPDGTAANGPTADGFWGGEPVGLADAWNGDAAEPPSVP